MHVGLAFNHPFHTPAILHCCFRWAHAVARPHAVRYIISICLCSCISVQRSARLWVGSCAQLRQGNWLEHCCLGAQTAVRWAGVGCYTLHLSALPCSICSTANILRPALLSRLLACKSGCALLYLVVLCLHIGMRDCHFAGQCCADAPAAPSRVVS